VAVNQVHNSALPLTPYGAAHDTSDKIRKGATDFEALLLTQMLRSAREAGGMTLTGDDDGSDANSSLLDLGEQQFAQALAASGGLGIAKMVVSGLKHAD
jgi:Rod binding domain-containing protein